MTERKSLVKSAGKGLSVRQKSELLKINRSDLYRPKRSEGIDDQRVKRDIQGLYEQYPFMGYRRITAMLKPFYKINRKRVCRCMKELGLQAVFPKRNLSKRRQKDQIHPYLLGENPPKIPNDCWSVDITYIRMPQGYLYLTAIVDVVSRRVMGWNCSTGLDTHSAVEALSMALESGNKPKMINSDQGCQFTSKLWQDALKKHKIAISMNGVGRCIDNIPVERFWRSLKYEEVFLKTYDSVREAKNSIADYMLWFNSKRPHQSLRYATPNQAFTLLSNPLNTTKINDNLLTSLLLTFAHL